ncbi:5'-methylthioadenosine/S-adenosylhomocysteine nucleosidase [Candidatus Entotheonellaceae bacterium PAL068K]
MTTQPVLGLVAALEPEARLVRHRLRQRHWRQTPRGRLWQGELDGHDVVLLCCGMGPERASHAMTWLLQSYRLWGAISLGFAGGLQASLATGDAILAQRIVCLPRLPVAGSPPVPEALTPDVRLVTIAACAATQAAMVTHRGALLSVAELIPSATAKARLGDSSRALAVDMESYSVGRVAEAHHLPFVALRIILDTRSDDIPLAVMQLTTPDGGLQPGHLLRTLLHRPHLLFRMLPVWRKARIAGHHLEHWLHHFFTLLPRQT